MRCLDFLCAFLDFFVYPLLLCKKIEKTLILK